MKGGERGRGVNSPKVRMSRINTGRGMYGHFLSMFTTIKQLNTNGALRVRGHQFQLPNCIYKFHKQSFIVSFLFRFLKYFFSIGLQYFSLLCAAFNFDFIIILINFDFILYYNLLLCFIQLEMHVRLMCY